MTPWRTWGRTETVHSAHVARPASVDAVAEVVARAARDGRRVRAVGSGHSFSAVAVAPDIRLDTSRLTGLVAVDVHARRARFRAGTTLHDVAESLTSYGLAMPNLGDIDGQTLAGAISTGTHGTGLAWGGLCTQVVGLTLVTGAGELVRIDDTERSEVLPAARLALGALGVLVEVELQCVESFALRATELVEPLDDVVDAFGERAANADHLEFYWFPHTRVACTKTNERLPLDQPLSPRGRARRFVDEVLVEGYGYRMLNTVALAAPAIVPPVNRLAAELFARGQHSDAAHRVFTTRRTTRFVEMEYALPLDAVPEAFREVRRLIETRGWRVEFPIEVRAAAADDVWLSTAYGRPTGYIAVHRYHRQSHREYFTAVEEVLAAFGGRPHWGKMHGRVQADLAALYPRFGDFARVRDRFDPARVFSSAHLERILGH
ncbi:FAD-linked oxidoreductase [Diaminobutyricimonas aerilata]|uniref:FAD-linked oxidoreductase n=1 Tax=Diaminobutyricimonas aerilata TaxID=1162967 RepID=A0A2M9CHZ3_9MICO|nr:D-arabinono-1,4-lactone oxidase [Diaminobutyricimonas aerilata]PJJ71490.1 FAD-linked oxidoreductase [Diaminobutyricimonas aerilata]